MSSVNIKLTVVQLDLVKSSESTSVIEQELRLEGIELFRKHIKEFVDKAFTSVTNSSEYDQVQSMGGDGYRILFQDIENAYQFVDNFCKSVEQYNTQANIKKRIFRIGAATGKVNYNKSEPGLDRITGHYVLAPLARLVTAAPGWFYVDKATFDLLREDVKQHFTEVSVEGKPHEDNIRAWCRRMFSDASLLPQAQKTEPLKLTGDQNKKLREAIQKCFNTDNLNLLLIDNEEKLKIRILDDLPANGSGYPSKIQALIDHLKSYGLIDQFLTVASDVNENFAVSIKDIFK